MKIIEIQENIICENYDGDTCNNRYTCCDCGREDEDSGCGCGDCYSCHACEACRTDEGEVTHIKTMNVYESRLGTIYHGKIAAEKSIIKNIERRLNLLHAARGKYYAHEEEDRKDFLLNTVGDTGRTIADWCRQISDLYQDLDDLKDLENL